MGGLLTIATLALLVMPAMASAATISASSCTASVVQSAIGAAAAGDTVAVPAGSCSGWGFAIGKAITLQAQGTTVSGGRLAIGSKVRVTGFVFTNNFQIKADGDDWRVDHNTFEATAKFTDTIFVWGDRAGTHPRGVVDHNTFTGGARVNVVGWSNLAAHDIWAQPTGLGDKSGQKVFVEDNTFAYAVWSGVLDTNYGGRFVFRKNTVTNGYVEVHSLQQGRASRSWEIYDNSFTGTPTGGNWVPMFIRGGTGVVYNNTLAGSWSARLIALDNVRSFEARDYGRCNGSSAADGNQQPNGWPCRDQIGRGQDSGLSSTVAWKAQASEPAYFWNNAGFGLNPNHNNTGAWIVAGRDYFTGSTPAPGYTAYPYPHPLVSGTPAPTPGPR